MGSYQHDPIINYNANLLKQAGTEQYTSGRDTTQKGLDTLGPVEQYGQQLLSGDPAQLMQAIQPEADIISQQFGAVRKMISDQPRGGGKTSTLAELPVEQIRNISNLLAGARAQAPGILTNVAGAKIGAGESMTGAGLGAAEGSAGIGLAGRGQDISSSWKTFFQNLIGQAVSGAAKGAAGAFGSKGGGTEWLSA